MTNRRWILYVLGISLLVPFLLEGWTFYTMFTDSVTGGKETGKSARTQLYGEGDEVLSSTRAREVLRRLAIEDRGGDWNFRLVIDIENSTDKPYRFVLAAVVLQDGTAVETNIEKIVEPDERTSLDLTLPLPDGTIPRLLRVVTGADQGQPSTPTAANQHEIPLESIAVRRESQ